MIAGAVVYVWHVAVRLLSEGGAVLADNGQNDDLEKRIARASAQHSRGISDAQGRAEGRGWAVGIEFVGTILVCGLLGWMIDKYLGLGTAPWGMIVLLVLGFAAGTRRAMQTSAQFDADPDNDEKKG